MKIIVPILLGLSLFRQASSYTVAKGDTLYSLSRKYHVSVAEIQSQNGLTGDLIEVGQELQILTATEKTTKAESKASVQDSVYVVQAGDSLSEIAVQLGVSLESLMIANRITNPHLVEVGQEIVFGGSEIASSPSTWQDPSQLSLTVSETDYEIPTPPSEVVSGTSRVLSKPILMKDLAGQLGMSVAMLNEHNQWQVHPEGTLPSGLFVKVPPLVAQY